MALFTPVRRWQPSFRPFHRVSRGGGLLALTERIVKGPLFGCRMCGNCLLQETAFICHMQCPKGLRNGPCGGVNNGYCYIEPGRLCVWNRIYERSQRMHREKRLLEVLPLVDWDQAGTETWGQVLRRVRKTGLRRILSPPEGSDRRKILEEEVFRPVRQPDWWRGDDLYHPPADNSPQSGLERELAGGRFVITAEITPPLGAGTGLLEEKIEIVRPLVSAINFTDGSSAIPRMASATCCNIASSMGAEPVLQISARDNNRNTVQSLAVGANGLGIRNILCLTGDSFATGHSPRGNMNIVDVDSVQMLWILRRMRDEGIYLDGRAMKNRPRLFLGAAASPCAMNPELQVIRVKKKINAGAQFLQTNLIFDPDCLALWLEILDRESMLDKVYILVGISPLRSVKQAVYLNEKIPGIKIPDRVIERLHKAGNDAGSAGMEIAIETIKRIRVLGGVNGVHLMPLGWESALPAIIKEAL